tara:strand:- start:116 stop:364 length:249 start_codon:yes stop_codon:yes gene_type:complete
MKDLHRTDEFKNMYMGAITDMDVSMSTEDIYNDLIDLIEEKYHDRPIGEIIDSMKLVMFQAIHMSINQSVKMDEFKFRRENK